MTFLFFGQKVKEVVEDKAEIRGERRMLILEKALERSECDRAALEKQLRDLLPGAAATNPAEPSLAQSSASRPPIAGLPFFNTRTDDIASTAMTAMACLVAAGLVSYLQQTFGVSGGLGGALTVMCGLVGFVFFVVVLFKFFLYLFGANSDEDFNLVSSPPTRSCFSFCLVLLCLVVLPFSSLPSPVFFVFRALC